VAKVVSILQETTTDDNTTWTTEDPSAACDFTTFQHPDANVAIEYLPCVATFGSYRDGAGSTVRYMEKIEYHGPQGTQSRGSSLAPFFDGGDGKVGDNSCKNNYNKDGQKLQLDGITAIAIGCGIEAPGDVAMIESFVAAISGAGSVNADESDGEIPNDNSGDSAGTGPVLRCIGPNADFSSMKEETEAYKAMSADEKAEVTRSGTIGPGKMAKFAYSLAAEVIQDAIHAAFPQKAVGADEDNTEQEALDGAVVAAEPEPIVERTRTRDPSKIQYACRMCRTILFDEDDLEDPPHSKASHNFSRRKHDKSAGRSGLMSQCESKFLSGALDWMGDTSAFEGKLHCPKCDSKVGLWKWAGSQCSCGTWVTPAIQIPNGKVDELNTAKTAQAAASMSSITASASSISITGLPVVQPQIPRSID
jgi:dual specificity phosphatase 12